MLRRNLFSTARRLFRARPSFHDPNPEAAAAEALLANQTPATVNAETIAEAVPLARRAAAAGSPRGQTLLGSLHREGLGVPRDDAEARRLFQTAADAGDPIAMCSLAALLLQDANINGAGFDPANGNDFSSMAEDLAPSDEAVMVDEETGERRGVLSLRRADGSEIEDKSTPAELVRRVRKARRRAGFSDAQALEFEEAKEKEEEREREAKHGLAVGLLQQASDAGNDTAMVLLGNVHAQSGNGSAAIEQYERAIAATRNTSAYYNLAQVYLKGLGGTEQDEKAGLKQLGMAAQLGDSDAQADMARLYLTGSEIVKADGASARQFAEMAAEQGDASATYELALMNRDGTAGFEASNGAFLRLLRQAADGGHGPSHELFADMHYKGAPGVEVDYKLALEHFIAAGRAGSSDALCSAAAMHFRGLGTPADHVEALKLYQDAAVLGNVNAHRNIGTMYFNGEGVPVNKKLAEHFFRTAENIEKERREEIEKSIDPTIRTMDAPKHPMEDVPRPEGLAIDRVFDDDDTDLVDDTEAEKQETKGGKAPNPGRA